MGQMEACVDDGVGKTASFARQIQLSPRVGESQELQLGGLEKTG